MPLDASGLEGALAGLFAAPPVVMAGEEADPTATAAACAQEWADALQAYAAGIVPASSTVAAAAATLSGALAGAFSGGSAAGPFDAAVLAFATTVGGGMAGFTGTPPPAPLGVASLLGTMHTDSAVAAASWATHIDTWMRTGQATPVPSGSPNAWA